MSNSSPNPASPWISANPRCWCAISRDCPSCTSRSNSSSGSEAGKRTRSGSDVMKKLALRIELSQVDEIKMMQRWLADRGQQVPTGREHHTHGVALMPGMLTPDDMARLEAAKGVEFDRLFLEYMIRHHEGALTMVKDLFASPGAAQESEVFAFASDVEADQTAEIDRMGAMLNTLMKEHQR